MGFEEISFPSPTLAAVTRFGTLAVVTGSAPEVPDVKRSASDEQPASITAAATDIRNFDLETSQAERQRLDDMPELHNILT
jgi:hypothetical protein